jgi:hypothetical protein
LAKQPGHAGSTPARSIVGRQIEREVGMYVKFVDSRTNAIRIIECVEYQARYVNAEDTFATQPKVRYFFHRGKKDWTMELHLYQADDTVYQVFANPGTHIYVMGDDGGTIDTVRL